MPNAATDKRPDGFDLAPLEKAANESAGKVSILWSSLILLCVYLVITTASISHRDLLLDASVKMPVLSVDLPVTGYFAVAPAILLVFHAYVVLQIYALFTKLLAYQDVLRRVVPVASERRLLRFRLDDFPFVRLFATSSTLNRHTPERLLLALICRVTLCVVPLIVMIQLYLAFLPYHMVSTTWFQRGCIMADATMTAFFWPRPPTIVSWRSAMTRWFPPIAGVVAAATFTVFLANFPGEAIYENPVKLALNRLYQTFGGAQNGLSRLLFEGDIDSASGRATSLFANRLILPDAVLYEPGKQATAPKPPSLRGRDLRDAIFRRADLRFVDFTGANLSGASMAEAQLQNASMGCANVESLELDKRGRSQIIRSYCTQLTLADLTDTHLEGTILSGADLRGARMRGAHAQGAHFDYADLSAADLEFTLLYGSDFSDAKLLGTDCSNAQAMGANFQNANLNGASMLEASLEGADFEWAKIDLLNASRSNLYRARLPDPAPRTIFAVARSTTKTGRMRGGRVVPTKDNAPSFDLATAHGYNDLVTYATDGITDHVVARAVRESLAVLDSGHGANPDRIPAGKKYPDKADPLVRSQRADFIVQLMCQSESAAVLVKGFAKSDRTATILQSSSQPIALVLDPARCIGTRNLDAPDLEALRRMASFATSLQRRRQH